MFDKEKYVEGENLNNYIIRDLIIDIESKGERIGDYKFKLPMGTKLWKYGTYGVKKEYYDGDEIILAKI